MSDSKKIPIPEECLSSVTNTIVCRVKGDMDCYCEDLPEGQVECLRCMADTYLGDLGDISAEETQSQGRYILDALADEETGECFCTPAYRCCICLAKKVRRAINSETPLDSVVNRAAYLLADCGIEFNYQDLKGKVQKVVDDICLDIDRLATFDDNNLIHDITMIMVRYNDQEKTFDAFCWPRCGVVNNVKQI